MSDRALLIGCGQIGALCDLEGGDVRSHARAYARSGIPFDALDLDLQRARLVAERHGGRAFGALDQLHLGDYGIVSICSETDSHAHYLRACLEQRTPLVLCEKPLASSEAELHALAGAFGASSSAVVVNYTRRFLPAYQRLRAQLAGWGLPLQSALVRYQRGFLRNGSHALDLLQFLFGARVDLASLQVAAATADGMPGDPTLTGFCRLGAAPVLLEGFPTGAYGLFEVELSFADRRVLIRERGDRIIYLGPRCGQDRALEVTAEEDRCLRDCQLAVLEHGLRLRDRKDRGEAAFQQALQLNLDMLAAERKAFSA